jgi:ABC-type xylose transport system permease subunit
LAKPNIRDFSSSSFGIEWPGSRPAWTTGLAIATYFSALGSASVWPRPSPTSPIIYFSVRIPQFRTADNALLILLQVSVIGIIAIGMTFTIIKAGIDLSVGSLLGVAAIMSGLFAQQQPTTFTVTMAFLVPVVVGLFGGAINGGIIALAGVNPLIVTLGTLTAFRGFVIWYRVNPIYNLQPYYRVIGQESIFGIPIPVVFLIVMAIGGWVVLSFTRFGRYVYAVGGNREAARAAGINVELVTFAVYVISGLCVGIAALLYTSHFASDGGAGNFRHRLRIAGHSRGGGGRRLALRRSRQDQQYARRSPYYGGSLQRVRYARRAIANSTNGCRHHRHRRRLA